MSDIPQLTRVREQHRFDEAALARYLDANLEGGAAGLAVLQFEGGQSNPTFELHAHGRKYVLRKKPPGVLLKSAHAVDREYRIMTALRDSGVPVPRTYLLCEDDSVIGTPFFVMEKCEGRVLSDPLLPNLSADERRILYDDFIRILTRLHAIDYVAAGLEDYGRAGDFYERQISRWSKQYLASKVTEEPTMDRLMMWLSSNIPGSDSVTIVHGDYRIGNCIVHSTEPRITAVLDWELSTIGHPLADLGYCCMGYHLFPEQAPEGAPTEQEFLERYCALAGRDPIQNWRFYMVFTLFRSAAISYGVYKRGLDGNASSELWRDFDVKSRTTALKAQEILDSQN